MQSGIYCIRNTINGKHYIGRAVDIRRRWNAHRLRLNKNERCNQHLQNAWTHYGSGAFSFEALEFCEREDLVEREQWWIDLLGTCDPAKGYNFNDARGGAMGRPRSEEHKAKISAALKGRPKPQGFIGSSVYWRGRSRSQEQRDQISKTQRGRRLSEDTKRKMSLSHQGKYQGHMDKTWLLTSPTNETMIITNLSAFCREMGLTRGGFSNYIQGRCKSYKGWKCEERNSNR